MSYPFGVVTRVVQVGPFLDLAGQPIDGMVQVQVPAPLKWVATGAILVNNIETIQLVDGIGSKELPIIQSGFVTGPDDAVLGNFAYLFTPILEPNSGDIVPAKYVELGLGDGSTYSVDFNAVTSNDHGAIAYLPGGKGDPGDKGDTGATPVLVAGNPTTLPYNQSVAFGIRDLGNGTYAIDLSVPVGAPGANGSAAGVPTGGVANQVLTKASGADFDTSWQNNAAQGIPAGGTANQILKKIDGSDYNTTWVDIPLQVPNGGTTGQVLKKNSNSDQDFGWTDPTHDLPLGGTVGQILSKKSLTDRDVQWVDAPTGGSGGTSLPNGGTTGQFLKKNSSTDGDASWGDPVFGLASLPAGVKIRVRRNADGSWPARPSARTDIVFVWSYPRGATPPLIVSSGTGGMLDNVDEITVEG